MNPENPGRGQRFSIHGSVIGSALGDNSSVGDVDVTVTWRCETGGASVDDLREAIAALLALVEAAQSASGDRIRYELQAIDEELDSEKPDGTVVSARPNRSGCRSHRPYMLSPDKTGTSSGCAPAFRNGVPTCAAYSVHMQNDCPSHDAEPCASASCVASSECECGASASRPCW